MSDYYVFYSNQGKYGISVNGKALDDEMIVSLPLNVLLNIREQLKTNLVLSFFDEFNEYVQLKEKQHKYQQYELMIAPMRAELVELNSQQQHLTEQFNMKRNELKLLKEGNAQRK